MSNKSKNHGFLCLPLAVSALILAGCGPSDSTSSVSTPESTPSETEPSRPEPVEPSALMKIEESKGNPVLPSAGTVKTVIVPLNFSNLTSFIPLDVLTMEGQMSGTSAKPYSVESYFAEASNGLFDLDVVVSLPLTLPEESGTILASLAADFDSGLSALLDEVAELLVESKQFEESDYDGDGDGKIDNLILLHGYPEWNGYWSTGSEAGDSDAASLFVNTIGSSDNAEIGAWVSGSVLTAAAQESTYQNRIIRTISDMLGVPEFQDTTGDINGNARAPLGYTDVSEGMSADFNPFAKYLLGWVEPTAVYADELEGETTVELTASGEGSTLLLAPSETGLFGEYLLVDLVAPTGLDRSGVFQSPGVRFYKIDSRLISGGEDGLYLNSDPDLDDGRVHDFAFTNSGRNVYSTYGVPGNFPLCELLDSTGANRHMANLIQLTDANLFHEGDVFGGESEFAGFYEDFRFDGNGFDGAALGLTVEIGSLSSDGASLIITRK